MSRKRVVSRARASRSAPARAAVLVSPDPSTPSVEPDSSEAGSNHRPRKEIEDETPRARGWAWFQRLLGQPVNGASLAAFRVAVGFIMFLEAYSLTRPIGSIAGSATQLQTYYTGAGTSFYLPYEGFQWLPLLPSGWISLFVGALGLGGLMMAAGLFYRLASVAVFVSWGYLYAVESTRTYWMSYYYLELLVTFLMIWIPAGRCYSVDAWRHGMKKAPTTVPFWTLFPLRGQLVITYFYAGVAKLNADWLLDAMPVRYYLAQPHVSARLKAFLPDAWVTALLHGPGLGYFLSWTGAAFDLSVGFLLLARRTRIFGLLLLLIFHATNHFILFTDIVWFPLLGITTALIFLDPDWPQRFAAWLRRPRLAVPDWPWFAGGAVLAPVVGASLGWKLRQTARPAGALFPLGRWVAPAVVAWLAWQAVFPLRHYFIPGDARITFEGLAFSWRLKAEVYRTRPAELTLRDRSVISEDAAGRSTVHWDAWKGDRVLFAEVDPGHIDWTALPELTVISEPMVGERVIYNPLSGATSPRTEAESRARANLLWQKLYGHSPQSVHRTVPLDEIVDGFAKALRAQGESLPSDRNAILALLTRLHGREGDGQMLPFLRRMHPFDSEVPSATTAPFLVIEDAAVFKPGAPVPVHLDPARWTNSVETLPVGPSRIDFAGGQGVLVYARVQPNDRAMLPPVCLLVPPEPGAQPVISWDYRHELPLSKQMHISTQPFLLRRYARHVADTWQKEYGHRPEVHAATSVSLNLRPPQQTVDPAADLASVSRKFFGHNPWIRDLELPRIPPEALAAGLRGMAGSDGLLDPAR